jgi:hypothetical protein
MRTQKEIIKKISSLKNDVFGFQASDLIGYLDFENAKQFLKEEAKSDGWKQSPSDRQSILNRILDYMPFAWEKANDCRGISAYRSLQHLEIWIWMLGDEESFQDFNKYEHYGKEHLNSICQKYGWDYSQWDNGERVNTDYE